MTDEGSTLLHLASTPPCLTPEQSLLLSTQLKPWLSSPQNLYLFPIELFLYLLHKQKPEKDERKLFKQYVRYVDQEMKLGVDAEELFRRRRECKVTLLNDRSVVNFGHQNKQLKHVVVYGKVANIINKNREVQESEGDLIKMSELQATIDKMCMIEFYKDRLKLPKWPKNYTLSDYLLKQDFIDPNNTVGYEISSIGNMVYNHAVSLTIPSVVLTLPFQHPKPQIVNFLKNSELCIYLNDSLLFGQAVQKNVFYRNYELKGINFVDEGEVDCKGRNIARGWVIQGKAKSAGYSWLFPPIFFFKYVAKNPAVWKQFVHDMDLNGQIPFRVDKLLQQTEGFARDTKEQKTTTLLNLLQDHKDLKLPEIKNISNKKIEQLGKLRHWDGRINDISDFKQEVLNKRNAAIPQVLQPLRVAIVNTKKNSPRSLRTKQYSLMSQRSIENIHYQRSNKSIDSSIAKDQTSGGFLTKHQQNDRYHQQPQKKMERRQSVLITSVLQRLSSMVEIEPQQKQIKRPEYMNMRAIRMVNNSKNRKDIRYKGQPILHSENR